VSPDRPDNQKGPMQPSPYHKGPVGPMPDTAQQKYEKDGTTPSGQAGPVAAQRNVQIIPEPGGQGNMPAGPKFTNIPGKVREVKIPHQPEPHYAGSPTGNIRIGGKVTIDLEGKEKNRDQRRDTGMAAVLSGRQQAAGRT
jgi:hypothetical protein